MRYSHKMLFRLFVLTLLVFCMMLTQFPFGVASGDEEIPGSVKIGVLAKRGDKRCLDKWGPTADYLTKEIPGYSFTILPLGYDEVYSAVEGEQVDFILANSSFYVELESLYNVNRIATLKNLRLGKAYTIYGGVIFCRADRKDINNIQDLKGKTFMSLDEKAFASWPAVWREMKENGVDPYTDFADLRFRGPMDEVVYAVRDGRVDAGSVRTDLLERMEKEGKIHLEDFRILREHVAPQEEIPFVHSTRMYPEWPLAKAARTSDELSEKVSIALINMSPESKAAESAICAGWTIPLNYQPVHECMKALRIGPYKEYGKIRPMAVFGQYWYWFAGAVVLLSVLFAAYLINIKRKLRLALAEQKKDITQTHKEVSFHDIQGLNITKKLWLTFGLLLGILTCSGIASYIVAIKFSKNLETVVDVVEPLLEEATGEEEIPGSVKIGVLAKRGAKRCLDKWGPTADYLTKEIPGYSFTILPLGYGEVYSAVKGGQVDFILANSSFYVELELLYNANRIATLKNLRLGKAYTIYGGVIFCRDDRKDIINIQDLKGKSFMSLDEKAFASWPAVWREMKENGVDPYTDFADLRFRGPMDEVVYAVRDGRVDAGSVRTDLLERMEKEGKIHLEDFRILREHVGPQEEIPFVHSTRMYPEWPLAKAAHTSDGLSEKVSVTLINMSPESKAAMSAICAGWTVPLNYQPVHECMKALRIGPYKEYGKVGPMAVFGQYWYWFPGAVVLLSVLFAAYAYLINIKRKLRLALAGQKKDIKQTHKEPSFSGIQGLTITKKLWLTFGLLLGILTFSGIVSYIVINKFSKNIETVVDVVGPLQEASLEMEINLGETARAVLDYVLTQSSHDKGKILDSEADFERHAAEFNKLAEEEIIKRSGLKVANLYTDFKKLGDKIVMFKDRQINELQIFRNSVRKIDELIDEKLQPYIDKTARSGLKKAEAALDMEINLDEAFGAIEGYISNRDPSMIEELHDAENDFKRFEKMYRTNTDLSADENKWLGMIDDEFTKTVKFGEQIIKTTDKLYGYLETFENDIEEIDSILDEYVQPLANEKALKAKMNAIDASKTALMSTAGLFITAIVIACLSALFISKRIIVSVSKLLEGARKIGSGDLNHRIEIETNDEFGKLSVAFNRMTEKRSLAEAEIGRHRDHLEELVDERTKALNEAQEQLLGKERLATLGKLTSTVSHELRNPLGTILSSLFIIKERLLGKDLRLDKPLERAERSVKRCSNIIEEMLYYTRERDPDLKVTEFDKWLDEMLDEHEIPSGIRLTRKLSAAIEISFDPEQLHRCVINVINNAYEAMMEKTEPQTKECEGVEDNQLIVETGIVDNRLNVRIIDSGPGISQENLEKVFEPLYSTKSFGAGLGLSIVKQIIEGHKGGIEIKSKPMKGTVITLWLPVRRDEG